MHVEIAPAEEYMGDIMGDLTQRRGRPQGMDSRNGDEQIIKRACPDGRDAQLRLLQEFLHHFR